MNNTTQIVELVYKEKRGGRLVAQVKFADGTALELDAEVVIKAGIRCDEVLSIAKLETLIAENDRFGAKQKLVQYLNKYGRKTVSEARAYLRKNKYPPAAQEYAVQVALDLKLLNDEAYAQDFAAFRTETRQQGVLLVKNELRRRGVSAELAQAAVAELSDRETQTEIALKIAQKKAKSTEKLDKPKRWQRLSGFLARRGFTGDIISTVLREVLGNTPQVDDDQDA